MTPLELELKKYDYKFPEKLIAQAPASPRDSAQLLVYNRKTKKIGFDTFLNLPKYLPKNCVLVFNDTKVIPARFSAYKTSGGRVTLLYTKKDSKYIYALAAKNLQVGDVLALDSGFHRNGIKNSERQKTKQRKNLKVIGKIEREYILLPNFHTNEIESILQKLGKTPLPPYIKNTPLSESKLRQEYQTIFAKHIGSVAAPTASLHFTTRLLQKLKQSGIQTEYITLHVGLGTFASLTSEQLKTQTLHTEFYEITKQTADRLNKAKKIGRPIIAVGTTAVRTLESACDKQDKLTKLKNGTTLFIKKPYDFKFVDGIITNFHVPKSSLLMLVSAFAGREQIQGLYKTAVQKNYRLFSFGDGMLIL